MRILKESRVENTVRIALTIIFVIVVIKLNIFGPTPDTRDFMDNEYVSYFKVLVIKKDSNSVVKPGSVFIKVTGGPFVDSCIVISHRDELMKFVTVGDSLLKEKCARDIVVIRQGQHYFFKDNGLDSKGYLLNDTCR
jgi:hypothetical protein